LKVAVRFAAPEAEHILRTECGHGEFGQGRKERFQVGAVTEQNVDGVFTLIHHQ
jgi:hypothetical protein